MRKKYEKLKDQYPEYISLDQFRQICRIAKRSALYLVSNGIIPAIDTGKKTWRYQIAIDDVIHYLRRREQLGSMIPSGSVSSRPKSAKRTPSTLSIKLANGGENEVRRYFEQLYVSVSDAVTAKEISILTGLSHKTILDMLKDKRIKSIGNSPRYIVPKSYLLDFVSSRRYIEIKSNSDVFLRIINGFAL